MRNSFPMKRERALCPALLDFELAAKLFGEDADDSLRSWLRLKRGGSPRFHCRPPMTNQPGLLRKGVGKQNGYPDLICCQ